MVLNLTLAIVERRVYGSVARDAVVIVIAVAAKVVANPANPILIVPFHFQQCCQQASQQTSPLTAHQAAAVLLSTMVSMQDAVRQIGSGVMLEALVPLPGETSKTASIAKFVLRGGIELRQVTGAKDHSIKVPEME